MGEKNHFREEGLLGTVVLTQRNTNNTAGGRLSLHCVYSNKQKFVGLGALNVFSPC